jgi:hypothetical protein
MWPHDRPYFPAGGDVTADARFPRGGDVTADALFPAEAAT